MINKNFFEIGKFWKFVIVGFFAMLAICSIYPIAYYAAVGYATSPGLHIETIESENLLHQLSFLWTFVFISASLSISAIFLPMLLPSFAVKVWTHRTFRYFDFIGCTFFSCFALYNLAQMLVPSTQGMKYLTDQALATSTGYTTSCINFYNIAPIVCTGIVLLYICCIWLVSSGYFLKEEMGWVGNKCSCFIRELQYYIFNIYEVEV